MLACFGEQHMEQRCRSSLRRSSLQKWLGSGVLSERNKEHLLTARGNRIFVLPFMFAGARPLNVRVVQEMFTVRSLRRWQR